MTAAGGAGISVCAEAHVLRTVNAARGNETQDTQAAPVKMPGMIIMAVQQPDEINKGRRFCGALKLSSNGRMFILRRSASSPPPE